MTYYYETRDYRMVKISEQEFDELLTFVKTYNEPYVVKNNYYKGELVTKWLVILHGEFIRNTLSVM